MSKTQANVLCSLVAGLLIGCQESGVIQTAFYTDDNGHFQKKGYEDEFFYLFREDQIDKPLYVEWQDVKILKITLVGVDKDYYKGIETLAKGPNRFALRLEALLTPCDSTTLYARQRVMETASLRGFGKVGIHMDHTNFGRGRLDRFQIDFDPSFLRMVRSKVSSAYHVYENTGLWDFERRTVIREKEQTRLKGSAELVYETNRIECDPKVSLQPKVSFTVTTRQRRESGMLQELEIKKEFWPVPAGSYVGGIYRDGLPCRMTPLKTTRLANEERFEDVRSLADEVKPVANVQVEYSFKLEDESGRLQDPGVDYLAPGTLTTDSEGKATLLLAPENMRKLAQKQFANLVVQVKAKNDSSASTHLMKISADDVRKWI